MGTEVIQGAAPGNRSVLNRWTVLAAALVAIAVGMRLHNSIVYPVPKGYDGFGHIAYIWYLLKTHRIPLADEGWALFHPPLFFAAAAAIWRVLAHMDPVRVMHVISLAFALLGLLPAWIAYVMVRRYFGARPLLLILAPTFVLFLPVCIYTAPMIGNEGLHAVLCAVVIYCLLRTVAEWESRWAAALGLALGLALLTKFTASGMVLASVLALLAAAWRRGAVRAGIRLIAVTLLIAFAISGWFYVRNVIVFGNPFQMSRDFFFVQRVENNQTRGERSFADYVSFDPSVFDTPSMFQPGRRVISSVWTAVYANAWFDAFGGWFIPGTSSDVRVRTCGRLILLLAVVPTLLMILGLCTALWRVVHDGWDDTLVTLLIVFAVIVGMYMQFTRSVPIYAALKASYLLPLTVVFSFWFALGVATLQRWPRLRAAVIVEMAGLVLLIIPVFSYGVLFQLLPSSYDTNARGVVYYWAGFHERAAELFANAARAPLYLAHENLATLALEEDDSYRALAEIVQAENLMPSQVFGTVADNEVQIRSLRAEYQNTRAYIYERLGWYDLGLSAARAATELDPTLTEAYYNQSVLLLELGMGDQAVALLPRAMQMDPYFTDTLGAVLSGAEAGTAPRHHRRRVRSSAYRGFPFETGRGDIMDAGIARRKLITSIPRSARPLYALARLQALQSAGSEHGIEALRQALAIGMAVGDPPALAKDNEPAAP